MSTTSETTLKSLTSTSGAAFSGTLRTDHSDSCLENMSHGSSPAARPASRPCGPLRGEVTAGHLDFPSFQPSVFLKRRGPNQVTSCKKRVWLGNEGPDLSFCCFTSLSPTAAAVGSNRQPWVWGGTLGSGQAPGKRGFGKWQ